MPDLDFHSDLGFKSPLRRRSDGGVSSTGNASPYAWPAILRHDRHSYPWLATGSRDYSAAEAVRGAVRLELVVKAILSALVGVGIITADTCGSLEGIALSSGGAPRMYFYIQKVTFALPRPGDHWNDLDGIDGAGQISALYNLLVSSLSLYVSRTQEMQVRIQNLTQELQQKTSELMDSSVTNSRHEDIAQFRSEEQMLSELQLIESSSRVRGLLERMREMENEHLVELERMQTENLEQESVLRRSFDLELSRKGQAEEARSSSFEQKLRRLFHSFHPVSLFFC